MAYIGYMPPQARGRGQEDAWQDFGSEVSGAVKSSVTAGLDSDVMHNTLAGIAELGRVATNYGVDAYRKVRSGQIMSNKYTRPDDVVGEKAEFIDEKAGCYACKQPWDWTRRQHHCRNCGHGFCYIDLDNEDFVPAYGYSDSNLTCDACHIAIRMDAYRKRIRFRHERLDSYYKDELKPYATEIDDRAMDKFLRGAYFSLQAAKVVPGISQAAQAIDFFLTKGGVTVSQLVSHSQFSETSALVKQLTGSLTENVPMTELVGGMYYLSAKKYWERGVNPEQEFENHKDNKDIEQDTWDKLLTMAPHALMFSYLDNEADVERMVNSLGHDLIFSEPIASHTQPALYLSVHRDSKKAYLAIRGTYNNDDVLTDLMVDGTTWPPRLDFVTQTMTTGEVESDTTQAEQKAARENDTCITHLGVTKSAVWMYQETHEVLRNLHDQGYQIYVTGHSLGAGCGTLLTMLLYDNGVSNIHCYGFGSPAIVTRDLAEKYDHLITSLVFHDDMVPRLSHQNAVNMVKEVIQEGDQWRETFAHDVLAYKHRAKEIWRPRRRAWAVLRSETHANLLREKKEAEEKPGWFTSIKQLVKPEEVKPGDSKKQGATSSATSASVSQRVSQKAEKGKLNEREAAKKKKTESVQVDEGQSGVPKVKDGGVAAKKPTEKPTEEQGFLASLWGGFTSNFDLSSTSASTKPKAKSKPSAVQTKANNTSSTTGSSATSKETQTAVGVKVTVETTQVTKDAEGAVQETETVKTQAVQESVAQPKALPSIASTPVEGLADVMALMESMNNEVEVAKSRQSSPRPVRRESQEVEGLSNVMDEMEHVNARNRAITMKQQKEQEIQDRLKKGVKLATEAGILPDLYVPGEIYHIYMNRGQYKAKIIDKDHVTLQRLELHENMFNDHLGLSYLNGIRYLAGDDVERPPMYTKFDQEEVCTLCKTDFTWASTSDSSAQQAFDRKNCCCCGRLVCDGCSLHRRFLPLYGIMEAVRVCDVCEYTNKADQALGTIIRQNSSYMATQARKDLGVDGSNSDPSPEDVPSSSPQ